MESEVEEMVSNLINEQILQIDWAPRSEQPDDDLSSILKLFFDNIIFQMLNTPLHPFYIQSILNQLVLTRFDNTIVSSIFEQGNQSSATKVIKKQIALFNNKFQKGKDNYSEMHLNQIGAFCLLEQLKLVEDSIRNNVDTLVLSDQEMHD